MPIVVNGGAPGVPVAPFVLLKEFETFEVSFECQPPPSYAFVSSVIVATIEDSGVSLTTGQVTKASGDYRDQFPPTSITYSFLQEDYVTNTDSVSTWEDYESLKSSDPKVDRVVNFTCASTTVVDVVYTVTASYVHSVTSAPLVETMVQPCKVEMAWEYHGQKVKDNGRT